MIRKLKPGAKPIVCETGARDGPDPIIITLRCRSLSISVKDELVNLEIPYETLLRFATQINQESFSSPRAKLITNGEW
jgi:hypothetical protein